MEKSSCCRPQRQRRHSRRAWPPEDNDAQQDLRLTKRLFTPDIKRMLKDWLIRRRENPYPSRDEKKRLALQTGLTYTQICNWFANWRRKLKNSERERGRRSWGHLIKNYNSNARGNVEQFSISSEDSIWAEELAHQSMRRIYNNGADGNYENDEEYGDEESQEGDRTTNSYYATTLLPYENRQMVTAQQSLGGNNSKTKYKQKIMEKYLREEGSSDQQQEITVDGTNELSKWIESAAKFTPNKNNYYIEWNNKRHKLEQLEVPMDGALAVAESTTSSPLLHHKDELDAAEALANLAFNCRKRLQVSGS